LVFVGRSAGFAVGFCLDMLEKFRRKDGLAACIGI